MADSDQILQRAHLLRERNRPEEAIAAAHEALARDPDSAEAHVLVALCRLDVKGERLQAVEAIEAAVALEPDNPRMFALKALVLVQLDKDGEAQQWAERSIAMDPEEDLGWLVKGMSLSGQRKWKEAEVALNQALYLDPDDTQAQNHLAIVLRAQGRLDESGLEVDRLLQRNAEDPNALATNGWSALQKGDREKAEELFTAALRIEPENEYAKEGLKQSYKARSLFYRLYLSWVFFMGRFTDNMQIVIFIGIFLAYRAGRSAFRDYPLVAGLLLVLYLGFVFWSWLAPGIGNLLLLKDSKARQALDPEEKVNGAVIGGGFVLGLILLVTGGAISDSRLMVLGGCLMGAAIPGSAAFFNLTVGRYVFAGIALVILGIGLLSAIGGEFGLVPIAAILVMASSWLPMVSGLRGGTER